MLGVGDKVPDFKLPLATVEGRKEIEFSKAIGRGDVVLAFYPLAFTGTCTKEVCEARDNLQFWQHVGAQVFGFSTDTPFANAEFAKAQKLNFGLISDPNREVVDRLWETMTVAGVHRVAKRGVLVVGVDGAVRYVWKTDTPGEWPGLDAVKHLLHGNHQH